MSHTTRMESPKKLVKAGKRVGITSKGLSVKWMDQAMFERAAAVLNPGISTKTSADLPGVISPEGVPKLRIVCCLLEIKVHSSSGIIFRKTAIRIPSQASGGTTSIQEGKTIRDNQEKDNRCA